MIKKIKFLLTGEEKILAVAKIHWIVFLNTFLLAFLALMVSVLFLPVIGALILLMTLYPFYIALVSYYTTDLVLTDKKILIRAGFLFQDWLPISIDKIETCYMEETILGRTFGYSTIIIHGTGSSLIAIANVDNGDVFVRKLQYLLSVYAPKELSRINAEELMKEERMRRGTAVA